MTNLVARWPGSVHDTEGNSVSFNIRSPDSICGVFSMFKNGKKVGPSFVENYFKLNNTAESDCGEF